MRTRHPLTSRINGVCKCGLLVAALVGLTAFPTGCDSENGAGGPKPPTPPVRVFASADSITALTQELTVEYVSFLPTEEGDTLMVEGTSGSVIRFSPSGVASLFTSQDRLTQLTEEAAADLGPLDRLFLGAQAGEFIAADRVSGLLIRIGLNGTPVIHSTETQITNITGASAARMHLPRAQGANQIIAQDLVTGHLLLFDNLGNPVVWTDVLSLMAAGGVSFPDATVLQWVQGRLTFSQFGRLRGTANIVKLEFNGLVSRYVEDVSFAALFPDVADLTLIDLAVDPLSDAFLALIGDGDRGVAIALVRNDRSVDIFAASEELEDLAGAGYDLSDIGVLADDRPFAVDRGNSQVIIFTTLGEPLLLAERLEIAEAADTDSPQLSLGVRLLDEAVVFPENATGNLILAE